MRIGLGLILIAAALPLGAQQYSVLVFSKTTGFRHSSIPNGIAAIQQLGAKNGFSVTATEDSSQFTAANLSKYKAVVFLNTTGTVLDADQKAAFESYLRQGGGYAGVHSASDTEYDWPFYGRLVCAYFHSHPKIQAATVRITDRKHPSTASLPEVLTRTDEWYNFRSNPRGSAHVLALVDESSYTVGTWATTPSPGATSSRADASGTPPWDTPRKATRTRPSSPIFWAAFGPPPECSPPIAASRSTTVSRPPILVPNPLPGSRVAGPLRYCPSRDLPIFKSLGYPDLKDLVFGTARAAVLPSRPIRYAMAKGNVTINVERCKGCGFCVEFCPTNVLALSSAFNSKGYHPPYM